MPEGKKYGFLIVEDENILRKNLLDKVLGSLGGSLKCLGEASDGEEALILSERLAPDILVTDLQMPILGGLKLIERLRSLDPGVKILIVTGFGEFEYARQAIQFGVSDFLLKPVETDLLEAALRRILLELEAEDKSTDDVFGLPVSHSHGNLKALADEIETFLSLNLTSEHSLDSISRRFRLNPPYLLKFYKRFKGLTPMRQLTLFRIVAAKHLLFRNDRLEIKQIANLVGYDDPLYFSRVFSRETGLSPSAYQQQHGE